MTPFEYQLANLDNIDELLQDGWEPCPNVPPAFGARVFLRRLRSHGEASRTGAMKSLHDALKIINRSYASGVPPTETEGAWASQVYLEHFTSEMSRSSPRTGDAPAQSFALDD